jgi:cupin superfamily acireductone dioxygenase involved in methionine salvage
VIVECINKDSWPTDVRAIVEGDGVFRFTDPDGGFEHSIEATHWDGDTLVHPDGNRFVFYELMRGEA